MKGETWALRTALSSRSQWAGGITKSAWTAVVRLKTSVSLAVLDQASTSAANFVLTVIAARALPIDEFGHYAIVWALSLLLQNVGGSLVDETLPAIFSSHGQAMRRRLPSICGWLSFLLSGGMAVIVLICTLIAWSWLPQYRDLLMCLVVVAPVQQVQRCTRRLCYLQYRQDVAARSSAAAAVVLLAGSVAMWLADECTGPRLVLLWGIAGAAASIVAYRAGVLRFTWTRFAYLKWTARECWKAGRWLIGSSIAIWLTNVYILPFAAAISGPAASGILRAEQALFMPVAQFTAAMAYLLIPHLAEIRVKQGPHRLRGAGIRCVVTFGTLAVMYSAVILAMDGRLLALIYHKPEITAAAGLLWPFAIVTVLETCVQGLGMALVAAASNRAIFWARIWSAPLFLGGAAVAGPSMGIDGVLWALVISAAVSASMHAAAFVRTTGDARTDGRHAS